MKIFWIICAILFSAILFMWGVNASQPKATHQFDPNKCTRFCHDKGCPHFERRKNSFPDWAVSLYQSNISMLKNNVFGLSYREANVLLYVLLVPILSLTLLWGLLRKKK
ncbi:MAG: hypothetical protein MRZ79_23045 [Bacteroidia bacterium]|nr:hypothetical protein [Bacteroidia bacterium]